MSVDHLYFEWYVEDGWLWVRHLCNGVMKEWHPDSRWSLQVNGVTPSFRCDDCGRHTILTDSDRAPSSINLVLASRDIGPKEPT